MLVMFSIMKIRLVLTLLLSLSIGAFAAEKKKSAAKPAKKAATGTPQYKIGPYPPKGTNVPPAVRAELAAGVTKLGGEIESLKAALAGKPQLLSLLPDVQIFHNAVRYALEDDIFFTVKEFDSARNLLKAGQERAAQLRVGLMPWTKATNNVVRGFVSKLDGSVQPYGLFVPASYKSGQSHKHRLDYWFHGRGDTLSEVNFLTGRMSEKATSQFLPDDTFVLHPYGRFMNANKFAGEVDAFEALEHVKRHYPIDDNKIAVRGFSMGGASSWHLGAHHAGLWAAVNPGAGFTDVWVYQGIADQFPKPAWYEQKLWRLYDATNYAANYFNTTLVAYSGEDDPQKRAADLMESALRAEGMKMTHIIGPKTGHRYEPQAREVVAKLMDDAVKKGLDPLPKKVRFVLFSLRFNQMKWVTVDALEKHWERATVDAEFAEEGNTVKLQTRNVSAVTLTFPKTLPMARGSSPTVEIDGQKIAKVPVSIGDRGVHIQLEKNAVPGWQVGEANQGGLRKRHGLQGPIDDAFMESFLFVKPSGWAANPQVAAWTTDEFHYATTQWRRQHRGEPRVKNDTAVTDADIAEHNLVIFGDPVANKLYARIADKLPIKWSANGLAVAGKVWPADRYVPAFIFPNPLNPKRYVVINSGFTFAPIGGLSNSQQTPKLPDWAVIDMSVPRGERLEKGVADANFFDEHWQFSANAR